MNDKQIKALIKTGESIRKPVGGGLYIRAQTKNSGSSGKSGSPLVTGFHF